MIKMQNSESIQNETCVICGSENAKMQMVHHEFDYKCGNQSEVLTAYVPVVECGDCEEAYFGQGAEEIKHEAVCNFLGRLTPKAIVELRGKLGMSQAQLAEHTGMGTASIKRWETGLVIQGAAFDKQLRELSQTSDAAPRSPWAATFRTQISDSVRERAQSFSLRPCHARQLEAVA